MDTGLHLVRRFRHLEAMKGPKQAAARGRDFNPFLADVFRRDGLDAVSELQGLDQRDEIDVHVMLGDTGVLIEAKWYARKIGATPVSEMRERLDSRPSGSRGIVISMSGFTKAPIDKARAKAAVYLLERPHVEALIAGLMPAGDFLRNLFTLTSRYGGSTLALETLALRNGPGSPAPAFRADDPDEARDFPLKPARGVTAEVLATADEAWTAPPTGLATDTEGAVLLTVDGGLLRLDPRTCETRWLPAPPCTSPLLADDGTLTVLSGAAAVDLSAGGLQVRGGGFRPNRAHLLTGPERTTWVFDNDGARVGGPTGGHHRLTQLATTVASQPDPIIIDFPGNIHQAVLTGSGRLYLAAGGHSVLTGPDTGWDCPKGEWTPSVDLTPQAALAVGKHTVLLAGPPVDAPGVDKALIALDTSTGAVAQIMSLPNTTYILALAPAGDRDVLLLTDIRGNDARPRPRLLRITLPAGT
ncbi:restriction endonuclease [Actinacidiphila alni]|uniref:restriction endonuclease n=1 Tax=Actinacidiphila alni TaxID=380248 RepID=UPI0034538A69